MFSPNNIIKTFERKVPKLHISLVSEIYIFISMFFNVIFYSIYVTDVDDLQLKVKQVLFKDRMKSPV